MNKPVEFHPEAAAESESAFDWDLARSERVASEFLNEVSRALDLVAENPEHWPVLRASIRFLLRKFPFSIVYRDQVLKVQVLAVAHARRKPGYWKART